ncbi:MAG: M48 family metalloprotease [Burkholderiales bacterium]|nr:M48 family metalloprotease [Burkholderiales bacterium]
MTARQGRRGFLRSACRHCVGWGGFAALGASAQQAAEPLLPARFARPGLDSDEGGLWAMMDREETRLRRSSFIIKDDALQAYLYQLVCKLGGEHCQDIRVHIARTPHFNASMAPNGMMQVWSGLLLRCENEAQLAAVLGHELGHYLERHTLERMRDIKSKAGLATFLAVFGVVGAVAGLGVLVTSYAFSREQEERADRIGMRLMQRAGFDGRQAAVVWDNLLGELKITGGEEAGKRSALFATHPPVADRRDGLLRLAGEAGGSLGAEDFERVTASHRLGWLQEEVRRGQFEESLVLFDRMLKRRPEDVQVLYARGEVFRLRDGTDDLQRAADDLVRATASDNTPAEAFRSLGLVHRRRNDMPAATAAFQRYLALAPEAGDAGLIKTYLPGQQP